MDLYDPASSTPDPTESRAPEPPTQAPGFYRTRTSVFYATGDGRVFLIGGPDEPVCLRPRATLPTDATPAADIADPAHHLVADTAESLSRPIGLRLRAEVGRDARVIAAAFLQNLLANTSAAIGALLLDEHPADPDRLHDQVAELVEQSRAHRGALSSQRINRRGEAPNQPPPRTPLPRGLVPFRHRGEYVGWFTSMRTGSEALGTSLRDAHVRGELWTVARDNLVYVFRCPAVGSP